MKICGVIAEYNPFHNGHAYQLNEARRLSGCDYLIVAMGGSFSQRGEVMMLDKWTRTRMALENGADAVVELPALFAVRSADMFASGGVRILSGLGVDALSFGCEIDDSFLLNTMLDVLTREDDAFRESLRVRLAQGQSHVRARGEALAERLGVNAEQTAQPNTALALEYMRVNRTLAHPMEIHVIHRTSAYHDQTLNRLASASAIRAAVARGESESLRTSMPDSALETLCASLPDGIARMERLDTLLVDRLRTMSLSELADLPDVSEGLENRLYACAQTAGSRDALLAALKCKRYTHARLSRLCAHAMLGMNKHLTARHPLPEYARLLGFRKDARPLLTHMNGASLPLVSRPSLLTDDEMFRIEMRAADLQSLCFGDESRRAARRDLTERMVIV